MSASAPPAECGICFQRAPAIVRAGYLECSACGWRLYPNERGGFDGGTYWRPPVMSWLDRLRMWWAEHFGRGA